MVTKGYNIYSAGSFRLGRRVNTVGRDAMDGTDPGRYISSEEYNAEGSGLRW